MTILLKIIFLALLLHYIGTDAFLSGGKLSKTYNAGSILDRRCNHLPVAVGHNNFNENWPASIQGSSCRNDLQLPELTPRELIELARGERIQKQSRTGRSGYGLVVVDVPAEESVVFNTLCDFDRYAELISTIRAGRISRQSDKIVRAEYFLSKFMLKVNILHTVIPEQHLIRFQLDPSRPNLVMRVADGFWFTETVPPVDESSTTPRTRVWLSANIMASRLVPSLIVDYAAYKALPRATTWLQPYFSGTPLKETFDIC
jgi:hypothetical protein